MSNCLFCNMADGTMDVNKIYEDEHIFVIKDIHPKAEVHLLVIPKRHIPSLWDVQDEDNNLLAYMTVSLKNFAKEQGLEGFRVIVNAGQRAGQEIFHLHYHLLGGSYLPGFK
jgi:histidine triad (HIT) family protein